MRTTRLAGVLLLLPLLAPAQSLYKYRGADGEWIYTDRQPATTDGVEIRELPADGRNGRVSLSRHTANGRQTLVASNSFHAPVQLSLLPPEGDAGDVRDWLLPPLSDTELMSFEVGTPAAAASAAQRYMWLIGDPDAEHAPDAPYRAPFPSAVTRRVSQAWPDLLTHTSADSAHAVDIAMPIGSDVLAARGGVVVQVASTNFRSSDRPDAEGAAANIVRIMHEDGTFAIYAHLNWNSIRVRPGERVVRGQYIADSGNTGFSTGPHLHFVVVRNAGRRMVSLPISFSTADGGRVVPSTGMQLTAY